MPTRPSLPAFAPSDPEGVRLVIMAALKEELAAVKQALKAHEPVVSGQVAWCQTGMGASCVERAREFASCFPRTRVFLSAGFCGGLVPDLGVGSVVLSRGIVHVVEAGACGGAITLNGALIDRVEKALKDGLRGAFPLATGLVVCVGDPVFSPDEKRQLGRIHQAVAVDMETAHLARVAVECKADFFSVRAVSDGANDLLPPQVGGFLDEKGNVRPGNVVKFALAGAGNLGTLWRLNQHSRRAAGSLVRALEVVIPTILQEARCTS